MNIDIACKEYISSSRFVALEISDKFLQEHKNTHGTLHEGNENSFKF
jgi:hypothetical protein